MKLIDILKEAIDPFAKYQLLSKKRKRDMFGSSTISEYLVNDENYTTPSGLKFNLKTIGFAMGRDKYFYYIKTDVYYKGKLLTEPDGIPGARDVNSSIVKAKKWLDKNGEDFIKGKKYQYKST
jgi:hypothetical protein